MSLIIWYKVEIAEAGAAIPGALASLVSGGLPLKVSNDVFSGQYIIDADITLRMKEGPTAGEFDVTLYNLPANLVDSLKSKHSAAVKGGKPLEASIYLGYFEDLPALSSPVMKGAVTYLKSSINEQGVLETQLRGQELGGYRLRTHYCRSESQPGKVNAPHLVSQIAQQAGVKAVLDASLNQSWENFTLKAGNGLKALGQIAERAAAPLVVRDEKIFMGKSVGTEKGPTFSPETNIVQMDRAEYSEEIPERCAGRDQTEVRREPRSSVQLLVLGDPKLRVGQTVTLRAPDTPAGTLRTGAVDHIFSSQRGYTCKVTLVVAEPGQRAGRSGGAQGVVDRFQALATGLQNERTAIDVGEIREYEPGSEGKHLVTLNYGQSPSADAVVPSVESTVNDRTQLHHRPLVSPFAWHKCGLILPTYKKMRGLLAHNLGLVNDAAVIGYLWAENPLYERPKNEPGDYWLCLPTELGSDGLPTGKGVNDLTDRSGLRVIQAKGLHIMVGKDALPEVGARPAVPSEDTIVIEHASGTKITIGGDGALKIETSGKEIALTDGQVTLKLSGGAVEVS